MQAVGAILVQPKFTEQAVVAASASAREPFLFVNFWHKQQLQIASRKTPTRDVSASPQKKNVQFETGPAPIKQAKPIAPITDKKEPAATASKPTAPTTDKKEPAATAIQSKKEPIAVAQT